MIERRKCIIINPTKYVIGSTGKLIKENTPESVDATFHTFFSGVTQKLGKNGYETTTAMMALVEYEDGTVHEVPATWVKFLEA